MLGLCCHCKLKVIRIYIYSMPYYLRYRGPLNKGKIFTQEYAKPHVENVFLLPNQLFYKIAEI